MTPSGSGTLRRVSVLSAWLLSIIGWLGGMTFLVAGCLFSRRFIGPLMIFPASPPASLGRVVRLPAIIKCSLRAAGRQFGHPHAASRHPRSVTARGPGAGTLETLSGCTVSLSLITFLALAFGLVGLSSPFVRLLVRRDCPPSLNAVCARRAGSSAIRTQLPAIHGRSQHGVRGQVHSLLCGGKN
eukprot:g32093.t1